VENLVAHRLARSRMGSRFGLRIAYRHTLETVSSVASLLQTMNELPPWLRGTHHRVTSGFRNMRQPSVNFSYVEESSDIMPGGIAIIEVVDIKTSPEKREELRRALSSLSGPTEAEPGCTSCQLYQPLSDPSIVRVESHWKTQSDFFRHIRSDAYKKFLVLMEMGCEPPIVEFYTVSELRGLGFVKAARELAD